MSDICVAVKILNPRILQYTVV